MTLDPGKGCQTTGNECRLFVNEMVTGLVRPLDSSRVIHDKDVADGGHHYYSRASILVADVRDGYFRASFYC